MTLTIDRYEIVDEIGQGAMATVYKAFDPRIKRELAIKILKPDHSVNMEYRRRFLRETKAVGKLNHPNIVKIYDVGEFEDQPYIAMELLTGQFLDQFMEAGGRFTTDEVIDIATQLTSALECAHSNGVIHRDLKPANIAWSAANKRIILTDFGIAHIENIEETQSTLMGQVLGTPKYMAPEQILGKPVDGRSDLFALGVILYQLLTGEKPFSGNTLATLTFQITQQDPPPIEQYVSGIPPQLINIVKKLLQKNPEQRFHNCQELSAELALLPTTFDEFEIPKKSSSLKYLGLAAALAGTLVVIFMVKEALVPIETEKVEPTEVVEPESAEQKIEEQKLASQLEAKINTSLLQFECSSLKAYVNDEEAVSIKGHISHEEDLLSLMDYMDTIKEASNVTYEVVSLGWPFCEVASILSPHNRANIINDAGLQIDTSNHATQLYEGNELIVELSAPNFESFLYVDYYRSDGTVVHLHPSDHKINKPIAASTRMIIGNSGNRWQIQKPYGDNQIVVMASNQPLVKTKRPLQEPAQNYLSVLHKQIVVDETPVAAKYIMVMINPKT